MSRYEHSDYIDRRNLLKTLGLGGAVMLAGCSTQSDGSDNTGGEKAGGDKKTPAEKSVGGTWIKGSTSDAKTLIPYLAADETSNKALNRMVDYGGDLNEKKEMQGLFFKSWEMNDAKDVVTYELRDNMHYGAGYGDLTVDDYLYDINHIRQAKKDLWHGYSYVNEFYINDKPIKYVKEGKYKFRAELPEPRANYKFGDYTAYMRPLPKDLLKKYVPNKDLKGLKKDKDILSGAWTGNLGAFSLDEWNRQSKIIFKRNDDYYLRDAKDYPDDIPYFDKYILQVFSEQSTITSALKAGDVTTANIDEFKADTFKQNPEVQVWHSRYGDSLFYVTLNQRVNGWEGFRKKGVRQAFALALDKQTMIKQINQGFADPAHTWSPIWGPYYDDSKVWTPDGPKIKAAKKKIQKALPKYSYKNGTLLDPDGKQVELKLIWIAGNKSVKLTKSYLKKQYEKLGIKVKLQGTSWTNLLEQYVKNSGKNTDWSAGPNNGGPWNQSTSQKPWDMMVGIGFNHGAYTPWSVIKMLFSEKGSFNWIGYTPEKNIAKKTNAAASADSRKETKRILKNLLGYISKEQPVVFTQSAHKLKGYRKKVAGIEKPKNVFTNNSQNRELFFRQQS
jgi:peptide/nickel transport system substrate-binding protein